jgi:hypothetical protein
MRLRHLLRRLLTLVLVLSLVPGLGELVESAEHLLHDGHLPHSEQHELAGVEKAHPAEAAPEHGCTPMSHNCGCHVSTPVTLPTAVMPDRVDHLVVARFHPFVADQLVSRANAPPTRPPIA